MLTSFVRSGQKVILRLENIFNKVFSSEQNLLYYHGAMPNFCMWMLFLSGLLLFAYYTPTLEAAYQSVEYITKKLPYGDVVRGIHRYAADAMLLTVVLHALRVYFTDRYREYRIIAWYSGIALLVFMMVIGVSGYILVWDERSYTIVNKLTNFLGSLPLIGDALAKAFLNGDLISNYTMSMAFFLHTGASFSLLVLLWVHYMRISRPVVNVTWAIGSLISGIILLFAGLSPAISGPEASFTVEPTYFGMDWFYLWLFPLINTVGNIGAWMVLIAAIVLVTLLPNFVRSRDKEPATVSKDHCVGCRLCSIDCPYEAIYMAPRTDGSKYKEIAVVIADRCAECGLCVGACNFDSIELPGYKSPQVMDDIRIALQS